MTSLVFLDEEAGAGSLEEEAGAGSGSGGCKEAGWSTGMGCSFFTFVMPSAMRIDPKEFEIPIEPKEFEIPIEPKEFGTI